MTRPVTRIAVLDDYQSVAAEFADWSRLDPGADVVHFHDHVADEDALAARLAPFDVVVAMRERTPLPAELIRRLPNLKLIVTTGMRNQAVDVAAAAQRDILVCGTGGGYRNTVELTWALILATVRHLPQEDAAVRAGGWQHTLGTTLHGATLGVLGLGHVGSEVARIGRAFGMDVIAWSENLTDERAGEVGARRVDKEQLLADSDVLTIHTVLSTRTRGLLAGAELARMKPTAVLINTSRGPVVDEQALVAALREGTIAGAGLDVFDVEPLPRDHPLRELRRAVLTPHLGYVTSDMYALFYREIVEDVVAWLAGAPIRVIEPT